MTPPLFLVDRAALDRDVIVLTGAEGRHAATVRRIRRGERVDVADGEGGVVECEATGAGDSYLELRVLTRRFVPLAEPRITVVQAIPKGSGGELAVATMTEVGVDVIVPWLAERCVVRWPAERAAKSLARWRAAARESAKQSRRARVPTVAAAASRAEVVARVAAAAGAIVLDHEADRGLSRHRLPETGEIVVVVGPEGGVSAEESVALTEAGAASLRLGPSVLRASTAGAVASAVLMSRSGRW